MIARTGVILAAGFGSRLTQDNSKALKPLTPVGGIPLLERAVLGLEKAGCGRVVVVVGFHKDDVIASLSLYRGQAEIVFAENPHYDLKNGVSVLAARAHLSGPVFVLAMADHVVGDEVMALARDYEPAPGSAALLVDYKLDSIFDMDDATKVLSKDGRIAQIGKTIPEYDCVDCGVFVCSIALMDAIETVYRSNGDASLSDGVQALAAAGKMHVVDIGDGFWQDVDTPEMLAHAEAELARGTRR
jgi:1L-myo-inositol 1-phosphate cytidylyltransferase